jgi:hypothetical protein
LSAVISAIRHLYAFQYLAAILAVTKWHWQTCGDVRRVVRQLSDEKFDESAKSGLMGTTDISHSVGSIQWRRVECEFYDDVKSISGGSELWWEARPMREGHAMLVWDALTGAGACGVGVTPADRS